MKASRALLEKLTRRPVKVFVYEYCSCQPQGGEMTAALRAEGVAMLTAVLEDLEQSPDIHVVTLLAEDFPRFWFPQDRVKPASEKRQFRKLVRESDFTLVIAPEFEGLLEERARWVLAAGGNLLGPDPEAIHLTADKLELSRHLDNKKVPTPPTRPAEEPPLDFPLILKPRFGAGALHTHLVRTPEELKRLRTTAMPMPFIVQEYRAGTPASVAFLMGPRQCIPLTPCGQRIEEEDGQLSYAGGWTPLDAPLQRRATQLARKAVKAVAGLRGFIGVDLVLGADRAGTGDVVIEINPRLTTSYLGLRRLYTNNLAVAMLAAALGRRPTLNRRRGGCVHWTPAGVVEP